MKINRSLTFDVGRAEVRYAQMEGSDTKTATMRGYAAKFNTLSELMWDFRETIAPGAFDDVLQDDVRALFNHDPNLILGRLPAGTLRLSVDDVGLLYEVDLPDVDYARNLAVSIERGDVTQSSFAFSLALEGDKLEKKADGTYLRTITKIERLYDVAPVTYPAYPDTTVGQRDFMESLKSRISDTNKHSEEQRALASASRARALRLLSA